jgi:hypothetical protein
MQINDFVESPSEDLHRYELLNLGRCKHRIRDITKHLLKFLGFLSYANEEIEFRKLKRYVVSLRGHYSNLEISPLLTDEIWDILFDEALVISNKRDVMVHLRLGDLLELKNKGPMEATRVRGCLGRLSSKHKRRQFLVYSDSSEKEVRNHLDIGSEKITLRVVQGDTRELILACSTCTTFIGTNSKVSLWVAFFRRQLPPGSHTYIPIEFSSHFPFKGKIEFY